MKIKITKDDTNVKYFHGTYELTEWLTGGESGYGDQNNAQAVVILTKALKQLLKIK